MRLVQEAHEVREVHDVAGKFAIDIRMVFGSGVELAAHSLVAFGIEDFVSDAHFDVVSLGGEEHQGLVLRLPAEPSDGAIVCVGVGSAEDAQHLLLLLVAVEIGEKRRVRNGFDQPAAIQRRRDSKHEIVFLRRPREVVLLNVAAARINAASDGKQCMDAAVNVLEIEREREARFPHWTIRGNERGNLVVCSLVTSVRNLRIDERTAAANCGLRVTLRAAFRIEARPQTARGIANGSGDGGDYLEVRLTIGEELHLSRREARDFHSRAGRATAHSRVVRLGGARGAFYASREHQDQRGQHESDAPRTIAGSAEMR
jgi:hypothetical protein